MDKVKKLLEVFANTAIVLVAAALLVILVRNYLLPRAKANDATIQPGARIAFLADGRPTGRTLLLALSENCHFCTESAPFYQRILKESTAFKDVRFAAILPQPSASAQRYLQSLQLSIPDVRTAQLSTIPVRGTPTLILTNAAGIVTHVWIGKLLPQAEEEVISH